MNSNNTYNDELSDMDIDINNSNNNNSSSNSSSASRLPRPPPPTNTRGDGVAIASGVENSNEGEEEIIDLRGDMHDVEDSRIAESTKKSYIGKLINLILYIYDKNPELIVDIDKYKKQNNADILYDRITQNSSLADRRRSKRRKPGQRKILRETIHQDLKAMTRRDKNSPVKLSGANKLTYKVCAEYMDTQGRVKQADRTLVEKVSGAEVVGNNDDNEKVNVKVRLSISAYTGISSAISWLYTQSGHTRTQEMVKEFGMYCAGTKRKTSKMKQDLGLKIQEGKKAMKRPVYELLAKKLFESDKKEHVFTHVFFVLDWNLMKRAENCVDAKINHVTFENDCLVFEFAKSKGKQNGEEHVGPWHVYANPSQPHICPILAIARYFFCFPDQLTMESSLFKGGHQYERYSKSLLQLIDDNLEALKQYGIEKGDLGTHSNRKGVSTEVAAGSTVSPPIASLCIRAGWAMGGVKERYIKNEKAGDQYVGRCASGLDQLTKEFAVSCPHFDFSHIESDIEKAKMKKQIKDYLNARLTRPAEVSPATFEVLSSCFASLCYHRDYLNACLPQTHILRASVFFRGLPQEIVDCVRVSYPWDKTEYSPLLTGVPPHVLILAELEEMKLRFENLKTELKEGVTETLNNRLDEVTCTEFHTQKILDALGETTKKLDDMVTRTAVTTSETAAATASTDQQGENIELLEEDVEVEQAAMNIEDPQDNNDEEISDAVRSQRQQCRQEASNRMIQQRRYKAGFHHGKIQVLPATYEFPKMSFRFLVACWFIGDVETNVPPLNYLKKNDVDHIGADRGTKEPMGPIWLRSMRHVMSSLADYSVAHQLSQYFPKINRCKVEDVTLYWEKAAIPFMKYLYRGAKHEVRYHEIHWKTIYNRICTVRKRERKEQELRAQTQARTQAQAQAQTQTQARALRVNQRTCDSEGEDMYASGSDSSSSSSSSNSDDDDI